MTFWVNYQCFCPCRGVVLVTVAHSPLGASIRYGADDETNCAV